MKFKYQSIVAFIMVALMLCNFIMPGVTYAQFFSDGKTEPVSLSEPSQSVSETVYESVYETEANLDATDTSQETPLIPEVTASIIPVVDASAEALAAIDAQLPQGFLEESIPCDTSLVLPLEEGQQGGNRDASVVSAKIINHFFEYRDKEVEETVNKTSKSTLMFAPPEGLFIAEDQVMVLNDENSEEISTQFEVAFLPQSTSTYVITATKSTLSYMTIIDNQGKTVGQLRTWPEMNNSIACKMYKGQQYKIVINLKDSSFPSELSVGKYVSDTSSITYKFEDNTYVDEANASAVVTMLKVPANILYAALDRDIVFGAELLQDGVSVDVIPEISEDFIRGLAGTSDDNVLQFVCDFSKPVKAGEYTVIVVAKDINGKPVVESIEASLKVGAPVNIFVEPGCTSFYYSKEVYFNQIDQGSYGKFLLFDGVKTVGLSDLTYIQQRSFSKLFNESGYQIIDYSKDGKFYKSVYCAWIPTISCNDVLKAGREYTMKFVKGTSEYLTDVKVVVTDKLIMENINCGSIYDMSSNIIVDARFKNLKYADAEKIDVILTDIDGNTVASKIDYSYDSESQMSFRLKVTTPILKNSKYSLKVSYPEGIFSNVSNAQFNSYQAINKISLKEVDVIDAEKGTMNLTADDFDSSIDYKALLYREYGEVKIPISELEGQKADENGVFTLKFPRKSELPLLVQGSRYRIELAYEGVDPTNYPKIQFSVPVEKSFKSVDDQISFYPPALPPLGTLEFTINGFGVEDGIMGIDNDSINIELIADNETYGMMDKSTIRKSESAYRANGGDYNLAQVMIQGNLNITKKLKEDVKYFIRINGKDYEYFYNSSELKLDIGLCKVENTYTSTFKDLTGNEHICSNLYQNQNLELNFQWVKNVSPSTKLVLVNLKTKEEFEAGSWDTEKTYYDGLYRDISFKTQLSDFPVNEIYELFLRDNEMNISLEKYIKINTPVDLYSFSVAQAVYGSDTITLQFSGIALREGYSFNISDAFDNITKCEMVEESERKVANGVDILMDFKMDTPLKYGTYKINMYNKSNKPYTLNYSILQAKASTPAVTGIQNGFPYLVHGTNLAEGALYTGDITDNSNIVHIKKGIKLIKRTGENILEIDEEDISDLPIGSYALTVKADGLFIGSPYFYHGGSKEIKPVVLPSEWEAGTCNRPFVIDNKVQFELKTLYFSKVRFSQKLEELVEKDYQTVTNTVYHEFGSDDREKILYFQFEDDFGKQSDIVEFKAFLLDKRNDITVISPEEGLTYNTDVVIKAKVTNSPHFVGVAKYWPSPSYEELKYIEDTGEYSATVPKGYVEGLAKVEIFVTDEVGNIINSKTVNLKKPVIEVSSRIYISSTYTTDGVIIYGKTTNAGSSVNIYYDDWAHYAKVVSDEKGDFKTTLNLKSDVTYTVWAKDSKGLSSSSMYVHIDRTAPVISNYSNVAQSPNSVRLSWEVTDQNRCKYTIWKDGNIVANIDNNQQYIASGLTIGTKYVYRVVAEDSFGNKSQPVEITFTFGDDKSPSIPENVKVISHAGKSITLSWDASADNSHVTGYYIYRNGEKVGRSYTTTYTDSNLVAGANYSYSVKAFDPSMNYSDLSDAITHAPVLPSVADAYDGSDLLISSKVFDTTLKALVPDILSNNDTSVAFSYSKDNGQNWISIGSTSYGTESEGGLIYSTSWNMAWYESGNYIIKYVVKDRDGFKSEAVSKVINILKEEDSVKPEITSIYSYKTSYGNSIPLEVTAKDNIGLRSILIQYSNDGEAWVDYLSPLSVPNCALEYTWNTNYSLVAIPEGKHFIRASAIDTSGNKSEFSEIKTYTIDRTPPEKLTGILATSTIEYVELKWNKKEGSDIEKYNVMRASTVDGTYQSLQWGLVENYYKDTNVVPGETYYYKVVCYDFAGHESVPSDEVEVVVNATITEDISIKYFEGTKSYYAPFKSSLKWKDAKTAAEAMIYKGMKGHLATICSKEENDFIANSFGYDVTNIYYFGGYQTAGNDTLSGEWTWVTGEEWLYSIWGGSEPQNHSTERYLQFVFRFGTWRYNGIGNGYIVEFDERDVKAPTVPQNLKSESQDASTALLSWDASKDDGIGIYGYYIYRNGIRINTVTTTSFTDTGLQPEGSYSYTVSAVDRSGNESLQSKTIFVGTLKDEEIPVIDSIDLERTGDVVNIKVGVKDNVGVTGIEYFYSPASGEWVNLGKATIIPISSQTVYDEYLQNVAGFNDGLYEVKALAYDAAGNKSLEKIASVTIRNTPVVAPGKVKAEPGEISIDISWEESKDSFIDKYKLYRSTDAEEYVFIQQSALRTYTDSKVQQGSVYTYKVTAVDTHGNESEGIISDQVSVLADKTPPQITGMVPSDEKVLNGTVKLSVISIDNVKVGETEVFYSSTGEAGFWTSLGITTSGTIDWNTKNTKDSTVYIKAVVKDTSGNTAEIVKSYEIDNTAPAAPLLEAAASELRITLNCMQETVALDFDHFRVYKGSDAENFVFAGITDTGKYVDEAPFVDSSNYYRVTAVDRLGNESLPSNVVDIIPEKDKTAPVIKVFMPQDAAIIKNGFTLSALAEDKMGIVNYSFKFRKADVEGSNSLDEEWINIADVENLDKEIKSVIWNSNSEEYPDGTYQFMVEAKDAAGNVGSKICSYTLANNPIEPPSEIFVKAGEWQHTVSWVHVTRSDFKHYVLYRKEGKDGNWEKIINNTTSNIYIDKMRDPQKEYFYAVSAVNNDGEEGAKSYDYSKDQELSEFIDTRALNQTSVPVILNLAPAELSRTNSSMKLETLSCDTVSIRTKYEYAFIGNTASQLTGNEQWHLIGEDNTTEVVPPLELIEEIMNILELKNVPSAAEGETCFRTEFNWNVSELPAGKYAVRSTSINKGGKEVSLIKTYIVDREAPTSPLAFTVTDTKVGGELNLSWEKALGEDVDHYLLYRAEKSEGPFVVISDTRSQVYADRSVIDGKAYYYTVSAVDKAGNESGKSAQVSAVPSSISDLGVYELKSPIMPTYGNEGKVEVQVKNLGFAKAIGQVDFFVQNNTEWKKVGSESLELNGMDTKIVSTLWTPEEDTDIIAYVKAVVTTNAGSTDIEVDNNETQTEFRLNVAPVAAINTREWVNTGVIFSLDGSNSKDSDGRIYSYIWNMGDGSENKGPGITHMYQLPGDYSINLLVTDNSGSQASTTVAMSVYDNRPDLVVSEIGWNPDDIEEGDIVRITADIGNIGKGPSTQGFLVGFYIDNKYVGYTRVDKNINSGESFKASFTWVAIPGVHVLKVVANDILDNLKETDIANNSKTVALTSTQVNFPDVAVNNIVCTSGENTSISSESPFGYRTSISNVGNTKADRFFVSLYIDGVWTAKQHINLLDVGETREVTFIMKPTSGSHRVDIVADDPVPVLAELDKDNNSNSIKTPEFVVTYPQLELATITWQPEDSVLTEGTSLTFETKVKNTGDIDIEGKFDLDFVVDGLKIRTVTVDGLNKGEEKPVWTRWLAQPESHNVSIVADSRKSVTNSVYEISVQAKTPYLEIIYPDLNISDVECSTAEIKYGHAVSFITRVSNQSVSSVFEKFNVSLYINDVKVDGKVVEGLRGHSTAFVDLTWTPDRIGDVVVKIVVDPDNSITQKPATPDVRRTYENTFNIKDALVIEAHPNQSDQDKVLGKLFYSTTNSYIPVQVKAKRASSMKFLGPEDGIIAKYALKAEGVSLEDLSSGTDILEPLVLKGELEYDPASGEFKGQIPITTLESGDYTLTIDVEEGGYKEPGIKTYIMMTKETVGIVDIDKDAYQHGEVVHVSGSYKFRDGTPVKNERIVLDFCLEPKLEAPVMKNIDGKWIMVGWHAETVRFVYTDEDGHFEYDFIPSTLGAGKWHLYTFAYDLGAGNSVSTEFNVWGMTASPSDLSIVAAKNSSFSKTITVNNMAKVLNSLSGVGAVIKDLTPNSGVRAVIDTSSMMSMLDPSGSSSLSINFNVPLDASDTAEYQVIFSSSEGATAVTNIKLYLRPATPLPVTDPKGIKVGVNPGESIVKTVTLTNKGLGKMENIKLKPSENIPWIKGQNLGKTSLMPGESTNFEVVVNPTEGISFGQYQDKITVTDGKYSAVVTVGAEVSSVRTGALSFVVRDDAGELVQGAEVTLVSKDSYVQLINGQEGAYYQNHFRQTDNSGVATFEDIPLGEYSYKVRSKGRNTVTGTATSMAMMEASLVEVLMKTEPVQMEWTVTPTTIEDKYDIKLELVFGANLPVPTFGAVPPWVTVPKQVTSPTIYEAKIINTGVVAITNAFASIRLEDADDVGISIVGGGSLGDIPAHGSVSVGILVQPGKYNLTYGIDKTKKTPFNCIVLQGEYTSFDPDTGLPVYPPEKTMGAVGIYNPGTQKATLVSAGEKMEISLPDEQLYEIDYFIPLEGDGQLQQDDVAYQMAALKLGQTSTIERQAFDATLKVSNDYKNKALQNLEVRLRMTDVEGNDVTGKNFIIPEGISGITAVDGSASLSSGQEMTASWQLIPGEGLGGENPEGAKYFAEAVVSYYIDGRYVETLTQKQEITILPQPKISLSYYIPAKIIAGQPFRLGVVAENTGHGAAKNLVINSGQLEISTENSGLITRFEVVENSLGSKNDNGFSLTLGDIDPNSSVSGYWLVKWSPYEDNVEVEKDIEGEFKSFKANLTHSDYNGMQLNPLIVDVKTEILGRDNLFADGTGSDGVLSLVDVGQTGFPNYLINIATGLKLPIYVPQSLNVSKQPDIESNTMEFSVPAKEGNPDEHGMPKYQVLMLKDPLPGISVNKVTRIVSGEEAVDISKNNIWKNNGNIFIADDISIKSEKPENYEVEQERYYYPTNYSVDLSSGARLGGIEFARIYYDTDPETLKKISKYAYYDIGVCTSENELTSVRAAVYNQGASVENITVEFYAVRLNTRGLEENEIKIGEGSISNLKPLYSEFVYCDWKPEQAGDYILKARILGEEFEERNTTKAHINYVPYADAGVDFSVDVGKPARFDGSRSYDKDGYIQSFIWEFGNGESGTGVAPVYTYNASGTYKVKLAVKDSDFAERTSQVQITVRETRTDLRVTDVKLSNEKPGEGEKIKITATIYNGGESDTDKPFIVGLYSNNMFKDSIKIEDVIKKGESKTVTFEKTYMSGEFLLTVIANDMGRPFDEADFDNNQRSIVLSVENSYLADIKVKDFRVDMPDDGVLDWNQDITLTTTVENTGMANAEKFNVVFYDNGKLIEAKEIKQLMYLSDFGNTVEVAAVWEAKTEGVHKFKVVADGFVPRVLEMNRNDNDMEVASPEVRLIYPDLAVKGASVEGLTIEQGHEMTINLEVGNEGYADVNKPFSVSAYAGEHYIGTKEIAEIKKKSTSQVVFVWNKPVEGVDKIKFILDDYRKVSELDEENNEFEYKLAEPVKVKLPKLVVKEIKTSYEGENAKYGDALLTKVILKNEGNETINKPFETSLYVNERLAGSFRVSSVMYSGDTFTGEIQWKADYLPTYPDYELLVYADTYGELQLESREFLTKTATCKVEGTILAEVVSEKAVVTKGEAPKHIVKVESTDQLFASITDEDGVKGSIEVFDNITEKRVFSSELKSEEGLFVALIEDNLDVGEYTISTKVSKDNENVHLKSSLKIVEDYEVTIESDKNLYQCGESITIEGTVVREKPVENALVNISILGEQQWQKDFITDKDGKFKATFNLPAGYGGAYLLIAEAVVDGAVKSSESKVFYVEGLYISSVSNLEIAAGDNKNAVITILNIGSIPLTEIALDEKWEKEIAGVSSSLEYKIPEKLEPGESFDINLNISTLKEAIAGEGVLEIVAICKEGYTYSKSINTKLVEVEAKYNIEISGIEMIRNHSIDNSKNRIVSAVRPGELNTSVVSITNTGDASIENIEIIKPEKLPWVNFSIEGLALIKPVEGGSISDENVRGTIMVNAMPDKNVRPGIYKDQITLVSNAGTYTIPIEVTVGAESVGTIELEVVDKNNSPINNAKVTIIGPHIIDFENPEEEADFIEEISEDGLFRFENIPAGTYTLMVSAKNFQVIKKSINVEALINPIPERVVLESQKIELGFDIEALLNTIKNLNYKSDDIVLCQETQLNDDIPDLMPQFPGDEVFINANYEFAKGEIKIINTSAKDRIYNVEGKIYYEGIEKPENALKLQVGKISGEDIIIGEFEQKEVKTIAWSMDLDGLLKESEIYDLSICLTGQYTDTKHPLGPKLEEITTEIPIRVHVDKDSSEKLIIKGFEGIGDLEETKELTAEFVIERCKITVPGTVKSAGDAAASLKLSQDTAMVDEPFEASFDFYNPNENDQIVDLDFSLRIFDGEINGTDVTENFIVGPNKDCEVPYLDKGGHKILDYVINSKTGLGDVSGKYYVYVYYSYSLNGKPYNGHIGPNSFTIEPPPKLYVSFKFKDKSVEAVVTNVGEGEARNVIVGVPFINGYACGLQDVFTFDTILPGDTKSKEISLKADVDIKEWGDLPYIPVRSTLTNDNMIVTPFTVQEVRRNDYIDLLKEVERSEYLIGRLMDRTVDDTVSAFCDVAEYLYHFDKVEGAHLRIEESLAELEKIIERIELAFTIIDLAGGVYKLTETDYEIGGLTELVSDMIIGEEVGGAAEFTKDLIISPLNEELNKYNNIDILKNVLKTVLGEIDGGMKREELEETVKKEFLHQKIKVLREDKLKEMIELFMKDLDGLSIDYTSLFKDSEEITIEEYINRNKLKMVTKSKDLLIKYINNSSEAAAYYPVDPILTYIKKLNNNLHSMIELYSDYRDVWIYDSIEGNFYPREVVFDSYQTSLDIMSTYKSIEDSYKNIDAVMLDLSIKKMSLEYVYNLADLLAGRLPFGGSIISYSIMLGSAFTDIIHNRLMLDYKRMVAEYHLNMSKGLFNVVVESNNTLYKQKGISESIDNLFTDLDEWRKIDPPLPVEVMSVVVPDVVVDSNSKTGEGRAILTIKNIYTGTLTLSPSVNIYSSSRLVASPKGNTVYVKPNETALIEIPFSVSASTLIDAGGYTAVAFIDIAEPETMSIGAPEGPYVAYFFAGTHEQIDANREIYNASQPRGRKMNSGEKDKITIIPLEKTGEIRVFMATEVGSELEIRIYDDEGNCAGNIAGEILVNNSMKNVDINTLVNKGDYIRIMQPDGRKYTIEVLLPEGAENEQYALSIIELPDLGAVPEVISFVDINNITREIALDVTIVETSMRQEIERVQYEVSELRDKEGNVIPADIFKFYGSSSEYIPDSLPAGKGMKILAAGEIPKGVLDGMYEGTFTVTVEGYNLNPELVNQTKILSEMWQEKQANKEGHKTYSYSIPVKINLNSSLPDAPEIYSIEEVKEDKFNVLIKGKSNVEGVVFINNDDKLIAMDQIDEQGEFNTYLELRKGTYKISVSTLGNNGVISKASSNYEIIINENGDPGTEEPGTEEPGTEEPGTEEPGTEEPGTEEPGTEEPGIEEPGTEEPGTEGPGTEEPGTEEPGTEEPGTEEPGTEEPGTVKPGKEDPVVRPTTGETKLEQPNEVKPGTEGIEKEVDSEVTVNDGVITVKPKLNESGKNAVAKVTKDDMNKAYENATKAGLKKVSLNITSITGALGYEVQLPSIIFALIDRNAKIEIVTPLGILELPVDAIEETVLNGSEIVAVTIKTADISDLDEFRRRDLEGKPVVEMSISIDGKPVSQINTKSIVKLSMDYATKDEEGKKSDRILAWFIDGTGKTSKVANAEYDKVSESLTLKVKSLGRYAVAFEDKTFDDIQNHKWAREQIEILASKGIINGTSDKTFSPGKNITRADAVLLIVKSLELYAEFDTVFKDVSKEKYYYNEVGIAKSLGIISGMGDNAFNPEMPVTRQDLMVMVNNALKIAHVDIRKGELLDLDVFNDVDQISDYAKESVSSLVGEGIIKGDNNNVAPLRSITRAETAVIVYGIYLRYIDSMFVQK